MRFFGAQWQARTLRPGLAAFIVLACLGMVHAVTGCSSVEVDRPDLAEPNHATLSSDAADGNDELRALGKFQFLRCNSCHAIRGHNRFLEGPSLESIVGRPAGSLEGFEYSEQVRALEFVWDEAQLDRWLEDPDALVPGMCLTFDGMPNPRARQALIAYLKKPAD